MKSKLEKRLKRVRRVRAKISGTAKIPRLSVFRSNKRIYAQVVDDEKGTTIAAASDLKLANNLTKAKKALLVGEILGEKLIKLRIKAVRFDRGGYLFHGRVKSLAEGVKSKGVKI